MVHFLVNYQSLQNRAVVAIDQPERIMILDGDVDTIAGKLYKLGIDFDVAEIAVDVVGVGLVLNEVLANLNYPRLFKYLRYHQSNVDYRCLNERLETFNAA